MIRRIFKWISIIVSFLGIVGFILLYQEYRSVRTRELTTDHIRQKDLVGDLMYPSQKANLPVIVFLGGSGGGLSYEGELKELVQHGYAVFSLAYFKAEGLPDKLENIPLEYFENAFNWLKTQRQIDTTKLLLLGVSRGAELALLLGSQYPQVKGVIAYAPGCFVLPNATEVGHDTLVASWTMEGKSVPFAGVKRFDERTDAAINYRKYIDPILEKVRSDDDYVIRTEKINGPILLISGAKDLVWPAAEMAKAIEARLSSHGFQHEFRNFIFEDGGHDLLMFKNCYPIISSFLFREFRLTIRGKKYSFNLGGTPLGVMTSKVESRKIVLEFLDKFRTRP